MKNLKIDDRTKLDLALDIAQICMIEFERKGEYVSIQSLENASSVFGCSDTLALRKIQQLGKANVQTFAERFFKHFIHPEDHLAFQSVISQLINLHTYSSEIRIAQADGAYVWCKFTISPLAVNGKVNSCVVLLRNINVEKQRTLQLELSNMMDSFTDIYNKTSSMELINKAIENAKEKDRFAFAILDINDFKAFNDTYGHAMGDELLKTVAKNLRVQAKQNNCIVGRFGGDEFIILVKSYKNRDDLIRIFSGMVMYEVNGHSCSASIGVSILNDDARTFSKLFKHADMALYDAKRQEKPFVFYRDLDEDEPK